MTLEIVLAVIALAGTLAGTGLGYTLSIRGKRAEWRKEYRGKRLSPLVNYIDKFMTIEFRRGMAADRHKEFEIMIQKSDSDEERQDLNKELKEAVKEEQRSADERTKLMRAEPWHGALAAGYRDKELLRLLEEWHGYHLDLVGPPTVETCGDRLKIARRIHERVEKLITEG